MLNSLTALDYVRLYALMAGKPGIVIDAIRGTAVALNDNYNLATWAGSVRFCNAQNASTQLDWWSEPAPR